MTTTFIGGPLHRQVRAMESAAKTITVPVYCEPYARFTKVSDAIPESSMVEDTYTLYRLEVFDVVVARVAVHYTVGRTFPVTVR